MENSTGRVRVRAGGRSEKVRLAVGEATLAFLAEGQPDFTVVEVAARAGVGRRTVYRWWPTRDDLLVEALRVHVRRVPTAEVDGSWEDGLRELAHRLAEFAADPVEVAIAAIMAGGQYPEFNRLVLTQWEPAMESWCGLVRAAVDRGEAADGVEPRTVVETLLAPIFYAPVSVRRQMTSTEVDALVDLLLCGVRKR